MNRIARLAALSVVALAAVLAHGCSQSCIRNTDCYTGESCVAGTCLLVVHLDGAIVEPMTPPPSNDAAPSSDASTDQSTYDAQ